MSTKVSLTSSGIEHAVPKQTSPPPAPLTAWCDLKSVEQRETSAFEVKEFARVYEIF
jgi:hypothetical protein